MTRAFNFARNARTLFLRPEQGHFYVLDGLRAIAILWVIAFHMTLAISLFDPAANLRARPAFMWTRWGSFGVDIFFVVSGFIIGYLLMKEFRQTGSLNIRGFYWRRVLRLLPAYYLSMLVCAAILPVNIHYVWANILYVNNFLPVRHQYMNWSWSLAIEEQFYILFPALLLLFARTRLRWALFTAGMVIALIVRIAIVAHYDVLIPVLGHDDFVYRDNFDLLYDKLYTRYGALLLGVAVAYYYLKGGLSHPLWKRLEWRLCVAALVAATLVPALVTPDVTEPILIRQPYYFAFWVVYPYIFTIGVAGILLLSLGEHAQRSLFHRILAARVWYPFAQLSYSAYLIHPFVIGIVLFTTYDLKHTHLGTPTAYLAGLGVCALIFLVAAFIYLGVERPFMNLRHSAGAAEAQGADVVPATGPATMGSAADFVIRPSSRGTK
jgi:peptidoglycan/LPS O-acetylase OafA/YrhL